MVMSNNLLSWNMRGSGDKGKEMLLRRKIRKERLLVVAIQETKSQMVTDKQIKHLWGNRQCEWTAIPTQGRSGGTLTIWDTKKVKLVSKLEGAYSLLVEFINIEDNVQWIH